MKRLLIALAAMAALSLTGCKATQVMNDVSESVQNMVNQPKQKGPSDVYSEAGVDYNKPVPKTILQMAKANKDVYWEAHHIKDEDLEPRVVSYLGEWYNKAGIGYDQTRALFGSTLTDTQIATARMYRDFYATNIFTKPIYAHENVVALINTAVLEAYEEREANETKEKHEKLNREFLERISGLSVYNEENKKRRCDDAVALHHEYELSLIPYRSKAYFNEVMQKTNKTFKYCMNKMKNKKVFDNISKAEIDLIAAETKIDLERDGYKIKSIDKNGIVFE